MIHDHKFASNGNGSVSAGTGRTVWQVIEEACDLKVTGEVSLATSSPSRTKVYLMNGLVYFAETETDESLATRLVLVGALDQQQLKNGMLKLNGVENLGRLFERDSSIDRDAVEIAIESITEQTLAEAADQAVESFRTTMYRHHPSGIHRWYSSQLSSDAETGALAPMVTIVPVVVAEPSVEVPTTDEPIMFDSPDVAPPAPTPSPTSTAGPVSLNGLVSMTPTTPEEPLPVRNPEAPVMRPNPPMVELATLLAHPSVPVPEPILLEPETDLSQDGSHLPMTLPTEWSPAAPAVTPDLATPPAPPASLVELPRFDPPGLVPLNPVVVTPLELEPESPTAASVIEQRADVWAELWAAAAEEVPVDPYGVVDPAPVAPSPRASSPWDPPTLAPSPAPAPAFADPLAVTSADVPTPVLPTFATPPVMKITQQPATPRAVLANAAPTFELDADGPRLPEHGASEVGPATIQPEAVQPVVADEALAALPNALDSWSVSPSWAQDLAAEITATTSPGLTPLMPINGSTDVTSTAVQMGLQPIAPMAPMADLASLAPMAPTAPMSDLAPIAPVAPATPPAPTVPPAPTIVPMARVEPTPAPDHLIPPLGSAPVPDDVAAAVRRAIAAIEAATLSTGSSAVSFGPMHVAAPTPAPPSSTQSLAAPTLAPTLAPPLTLIGSNAFPKLADTPTSPNGIPLQNPDGLVTPLLSLSTPMSGTAFAPALSGLGTNGSGPHLPELPAKPAGPPNGIERRSALRRLVDNIRGH
ncbi:MAG: hypothetical protein JWN39_3377 [Ilumatobacteraceae bacterium]|nr:hypothetical protein [Ilumatobacteraceae bacterium]